MNERLQRYLWEAYGRDILGKQGRVEMPELTPEMIAAVNAEIARIDRFRLGASLASRDYPSYVARQHLAGLLATLEA